MAFPIDKVGTLVELELGWKRREGEPISEPTLDIDYFIPKCSFRSKKAPLFVIRSEFSPGEELDPPAIFI